MVLFVGSPKTDLWIANENLEYILKKNFEGKKLNTFE